MNLDALTYAARPAALKSLEARDDYHFVKGDIRDAALLCDLFARFQPDAVIHMAWASAGCGSCIAQPSGDPDSQPSHCLAVWLKETGSWPS